MNNPIIRSSKPELNTWLGREGEITNHFLRDEKRIVVIKWLDGSDEALIKLVKGDGRRAGFVSYHEETVSHALIDARIDHLIGL